MAFVLLKFTYILLLSFVYGVAVTRPLSRLTGNPELPSPSLTGLTGLIVLNVLASYLSLVLPMGTLANLLVLGLGIVLAVVCRKNLVAAWGTALSQARAASTAVKLFFILSVFFILFFSSLQSLTYDEGLYYSQFIRWIRAYPVVPGLANLHDRFGFNSGWHVLAGLFNWGMPFNPVNGVLYILTILYLLGGSPGTLSRFIKGGLLVLVHMPWVGVYHWIAPAADLVVFYLLSLLIVLWVEQLERGAPLPGAAAEKAAGKGPSRPTAPLAWIIPAYLLTVKLSAVPVLLLTALLCLQAWRSRRYRSLAGLLSLSLFVVLPWLIRNVILSGYLLFPFERLDLLGVDWKVPAAKVRETREAIEAFGFLRNKVSATIVHSRVDRLKFLFRHNIRLYDFVILLAIPLSPFIVWWKRMDRSWMLLFVFIWTGILFWFLQAPDPRFGYGYLAPLLVLVLGLCLPRLNLQTCFLLGALGFEAGSLFLYHHLKKQLLSEGTIVQTPRPAHWWRPQPYPSTPVDTHQAPFEYYTPEHLDLCWGTDLPCADQVREDIRLRGAGLGEGFAPAGAGDTATKTPPPQKTPSAPSR